MVKSRKIISRRATSRKTRTVKSRVVKSRKNASRKHVKHVKHVKPRVVKSVSRKAISRKPRIVKSSSRKVDRQKDICVEEHSVGVPISQKDALNTFFTDSIDLSKVPSIQKDSITSEGFEDPITGDTILLRKCLQLKNEGHIFPKDTLKDEYLKKTKWMGKESVGFKNPYTKCIYGNLVEYNYTEHQTPQKNGKLVISRENRDFHKLTYETPNNKPYLFSRDSKKVELYYPDTPEGRVVIMLFIDSFIKRNLFAFEENKVLNGRIHKKTILKSTARQPYGYPDETFAVRVMGELFDQGTTPYIVSQTGLENYKVYVNHKDNKVVFKDEPLEYFFSAIENT